MALLLKDRVKESTTTTGTGTLTLVAAPSGYRRFSAALSNGDTTYYCIESGASWEVGLGTYSANTLTRDTVLASSNAGSKIEITAARSYVFITYAADKAVYENAAGEIKVDSALRFSDNSVQSTAFLGEVDFSGVSGLPANTILGNNTGSTGDALALTPSQVRAVLGLATTDNVTFNTVTATTSVITPLLKSASGTLGINSDDVNPVTIGSSTDGHYFETGGIPHINFKVSNVIRTKIGTTGLILNAGNGIYFSNTLNNASATADGCISRSGVGRVAITTGTTWFNSGALGTLDAAAVSNTTSQLTLTGGPDAGYFSTEGVILRTASSATAYCRAGAGILYLHQTGLNPAYFMQLADGNLNIVNQTTNGDIDLYTYGASGYVNVYNNTHNGIFRVSTVVPYANEALTLGNATYGVTVPGALGVGGAASRGKLHVKQTASTYIDGFAIEEPGGTDSFLSMRGDSVKFIIEPTYQSAGSYKSLHFRTGGVDALVLATTGAATFSGTATATSATPFTSGLIARGPASDNAWGGGIDFTSNAGTVHQYIRSDNTTLYQTKTTFSDDVLMKKTSAQGYIRAYGTGGVNSIAMYDDNTNGILSTSSGNLNLVPAGGTVAVTGGIMASGAVSIDTISSGAFALTLKGSGAAHPLRIQNGAGTNLFYIDVNGVPTHLTNGYSSFAHTSSIGDPNMIISGGGTGLGLQTSGGLFVATGGSVTTFSVASTGAVSCAGVTASGLIKGSETTSTPSGTTQTITLESGNCQTLDLTSSTGDVTVTLTVPASSAFGSLLIKQHATTARDITWAASAGSIVWLGSEPTWNTDATSSYREVRWRFNGTNTYLSASGVS